MTKQSSSSLIAPLAITAALALFMATALMNIGQGAHAPSTDRAIASEEVRRG